MKNENRTYDLKVEKIISKTAPEVFQAISEGRIFSNCGADQELMKIDFRVGGKYSITFLNYQMKNGGEFLEIIPNQKIVFTWCQDYESHPTPDTKVQIELKSLGDKTELTLTHTGFTDLENKDAHQGGWNSGLTDLSHEMVDGKIRLVRKLPLSLSKLFEACKKISEGTPLESILNQKIVFKQNQTQVTFLFESEDENSAWLELIHEGFLSDADLKKQRLVWDLGLKNLSNRYK